MWPYFLTQLAVSDSVEDTGMSPGTLKPERQRGTARWFGLSQGLRRSKEIVEVFYEAALYSGGGRHPSFPETSILPIFSTREHLRLRKLLKFGSIFFFFPRGLVTSGVASPDCLTWALIQRKNIRCTGGGECRENKHRRSDLMGPWRRFLPSQT